MSFLNWKSIKNIEDIKVILIFLMEFFIPYSLKNYAYSSWLNMLPDLKVKTKKLNKIWEIIFWLCKQLHQPGENTVSIFLY